MFHELIKNSCIFSFQFIRHPDLFIWKKSRLSDLIVSRPVPVTPSAFWCGCTVCSPAPVVCWTAATSSFAFNTRRWERCGSFHTSQAAIPAAVCRDQVRLLTWSHTETASSHSILMLLQQLTSETAAPIFSLSCFWDFRTIDHRPIGSQQVWCENLKPKAHIPREETCQWSETKIFAYS